MESYLRTLEKIIRLSSLSTNLEENWGYIKLSGNENTNLLDTVKEIKDELALLGFSNLVRIEINNGQVDDDDFEEYQKEPAKIANWKVDINKLPIVNKRSVEGFHYNFFTSTDRCNQWLKTTDPLLQTCPFNNLNPLKVLIEGLACSFGGEQVQFIAPGSPTVPPLSVNYNLPDRDKLRENIHFITNDNVNINLKAYSVQGGTGSDVEELFITKACIALTTCIVNEYYSFNKVILDGIKRVVISIDDGRTKINYDFYLKLLRLVDWIYEDRISIRKKLFNERLSLDLDTSGTLLEALTTCVDGALNQAKERYNFVIVDRKDAYVKELKELLKDVRMQSELYSVKIRNLLSNFLRDLLAAIVLIGFTIFTKFTDNTNLANQNLLKYVFYGLSAYYILSIFMQTIVDWIDINVSKLEILYWKNATKELLPEQEFKAHIDRSLKGRRRSLRIIYPLFVLCYLLIALACWKYPTIFQSTLQENKNIKARVSITPIPGQTP